MTPRFLLVDHDGVLANFDAGVIDAVASASNGRWILAPDERREFRVASDYRRCFGSEAATLAVAASRKRGFFASLTEVPGAMDALLRLDAAGIQIRICSGLITANPTCASEKIDWIASRLGATWVNRIIFAKDKTWIRGDVLIDDWPRQEGNMSPTWVQVLYDTPPNQGLPGPRLARWDDVEAVIARLR